MAGSFNAKRAYLARALGERHGISRWASETHVIAALWSSEILHALKLRAESFRSICPDPPDAFSQWWVGNPPRTGVTSALVVLDPLATGRRRAFVGLDHALTSRRRYRGLPTPSPSSRKPASRRRPSGFKDQLQSVDLVHLLADLNEAELACQAQ